MNKVTLGLRYLVVMIAVVFLNACVTTTDSRLSKKASPEKAVENYTQLGLGYLQRGRPDWARERLHKALEIDPDDPAANDAMGLVWQTEGELDLAEEFFKKALKEKSDFVTARHHLGRLYMQTGRFKEAVQPLETAANDRYFNNRVEAYSDLALNYYRMDMPEQAITAYLQALRLAPYNVDALVNASTLLFEKQNYDESLKYFDRFDRLVQREQTLHTAHSLWLGIRLTTIKLDTARSIQFASELKRRFSNSNEYRMYQESLSGSVM
ncbi:MAG: tetratricopeptide repeat protein [Oleibacter sp.]|nr:tetratricopeptide repeat protein [Thalassolituus sp.]